MSVRKNYFVTNEFSKELGGAAKTIGTFQKALSGTIIGFNTENFAEQENVVKFRANHGLLGSLYGLSSEANRKFKLLNQSSPAFFSCHLLFRHHCSWVAKTAKRTNSPYWVVPHGALDPWVFSYRSLQKKAWLKLVGEKFIKNANAVVFATRRELEKASKLFEIENAFVIHWPVSPIPLNNYEERRIAWRKQLGLSLDDRVLLYLGRYTEMKRPLETILYFANSTPNSDCHLVLVGNDSGITRAQLKDAVPANLKKQVHVLGPLWAEKRDNALIGSDGFILLSHRENFGHTVAEAASARLPVIISPGNDLIGEIAGEKFCRGLETLSEEEAIDAIQHFFRKSTSELQEAGNAGREWVQQNLGVERFGHELGTLYEATAT